MTWGLLVIIVNIAYLLLSMLIGYIAYKFFEHKYKHIGKIVFIVVLLAPFWDLIIQKGVKTYYQAFKMEAKIYAYPELDEDGKIESLDLTSSFSREPLSYFSNHLNLKYKENIFKEIDIKQLQINYFNKQKVFDDRIKNFLELKVFDDNDVEKKLRIRFDEFKPQFEFINKGTARYKTIRNSEKYLFDLYTVNEYLLIDNKTGKILAKDMSVGFKKGSKSKLRNKILLWKSANDQSYRLSSISDSDIIEKLLKIINI